MQSNHKNNVESRNKWRYSIKKGHTVEVILPVTLVKSSHQKTDQQ